MAAALADSEEIGCVEGLHYVLQKPKGAGPWPVLLFLHGASERGREDGSQLSQVLPASFVVLLFFLPRLTLGLFSSRSSSFRCANMDRGRFVACRDVQY